MRIEVCKWLAALVAALTLAGCSCTEHNRVALPTGDSYTNALVSVQRQNGTIRVDVLPFSYKPQSAEGQILVKLRYVRFVNGRSQPIGEWAAHVPAGAASDPFYALTLPIGHQIIDRLTFAGKDDSSCSPTGAAVNEYGYDAHIDRLTSLGRALTDAHLLVVGYKNDRRVWNGKLHANGVSATYQSAAYGDAADERGEPIRLLSFATKTGRKTLDF